MRATLTALLVLAAAQSSWAGDPEPKDWKDHMGNIPFIVGREAGMKEAEFTGKPILFFYTATW